MKNRKYRNRWNNLNKIISKEGAEILILHARNTEDYRIIIIVGAN